MAQSSNTDGGAAVGYDLDTLTTGGVVVDDAGRPLLAAGLAQWWQRTARVLAATPGSILGYPTVGAGFDAAIEAPLTTALLDALVADATATLAADPLTSAVGQVAVTRDGPYTLHLDAEVSLGGGNAGSMIPVRWAFSGAGAAATRG